MHKPNTLLVVTLAAALFAAGACSDDETRTVTRTVTDTVTVAVHDTVRFGENRVFTQVERLGNPLVSEVTLDKRDHSFHNAGVPSTDYANFQAKLEKFVTGVAGRPQSVASTLSTVLLKSGSTGNGGDMLVVQTAMAPSTAGWLTWALANGYGGRRLQDDVTAAGLQAIFGPLLLNDATVKPGLANDNVPTNDVPFLTTFPYLAAAH